MEIEQLLAKSLQQLQNNVQTALTSLASRLEQLEQRQGQSAATGGAGGSTGGSGQRQALWQAIQALDAAKWMEEVSRSPCRSCSHGAPQIYPIKGHKWPRLYCQAMHQQINLADLPTACGLAEQDRTYKESPP